MNRILSRLCAGLALIWVWPAFAATVTHEAATADTGADPNTSAAFTPVSGDLLVVGICAAGSQGGTPTLTSSIGGNTFVLAETQLYSDDQMLLFVADQLIAGGEDVSQTVAIDSTSTYDGTHIMVAAVAGTTADGLAAIRQQDDATSAAAGTPVGTFPAAALTGNPTLGFFCNGTNPAGVTPPTSWTEAADIGHATPNHGGEYVYRNSGFTGTAVTWGSTSATDGGIIIVEIDVPVAPTFTAGPTIGTKTDTTLPFTFTLSETGTVYGVACPDGQAAPTVAQVKLGQCTGGVGAVGAFSEAVVAAVSDSDSLSGLTASTTYDTHFAATGTTLDTAAITTVANQTTNASGGGVLTGAPTVTAQDTNDYTISGTTTAAVTIYAVACKKDQTAPTIAQVTAADCTGNVNAVAAVNESWNGANDFILGGALTFPIHDLYVTDGTTRYTLADEVLDVPADKQRLTLTSVHATSPYFGQAPASGDIATCDTVTDPSAYVITNEVDGTISYAAGGDNSRQFIECDVYDVSAAANLFFLFVYNNHRPMPLDLDGYFPPGSIYRIGVSPGVDLEAQSEDAEGDDIDWTVLSGVLPVDWTLDAETGDITDGSPGDCDFYEFTIRLTDSYGSTTDDVGEVIIGDLVPDPTGMTPAEFIAALAADFCVP